MRLKDDDECRANTHECDPHATCANDVVGSYSCYCRSGYIDEVGDGRTCTDIDECETGDYAECPDDKICFNTPGSYACVLDTEPPSQSPSTPYPSGTPTGEFDKCNQILTSPAGNWCGIDGTPFGCSCDNTCAATDNCCWDYRNACAPFVDNTAVAVFQTSTVDVKFVAGGGNERNDASGILRCNGQFLARGVSNGCGFNLAFSTFGGNSHALTCDCITLEMIERVDGIFEAPASIEVYYNGIKALGLSDGNGLPFAMGTYSLDCSRFS